MIVNYFEPAFNFELKPQEAINYFVGKGLKPTYNWYEMINSQHDISFTVAKMLDLDLLKTVQDSVTDAISNGKTLQQFKDELTPILQQKGWWGKAIDGMSGKSIQLGSASRLETIFRTNMQSAYAAGQWEQIVANQDAAPYLLYDAVDDGRTRESHRQFDGTVLPVEHKFWNTNYPPNGWNCRCGVIQMDADDLEDYGLSISKMNTIATSKWTNPMTGKTVKVPVGVDPGFAHNPGISMLDKLQALQAQKLTKMNAPEAAAAKKGIKASKDKAQQKKAQQEKLQAEKEAKIAIAKAQAAEVATAELVKIASGNAQKQPGLKKKIYDKYKKEGLVDDYKDDPALLVEIIEDIAQQQQAKAEISSAIAGYKKKVLAGKLPTPKQQKVFDGLDEAQKKAVIADIDKKKEAAKPAPVKEPATVKTPESDELNMDNMKQIGGQGGSNPGGTYYDETTGKKWYIKHMDSKDRAQNEVLAAKLYEEAGIEVANVRYFEQNGKFNVASEIIDGLVTDAGLLKKASGAKEGYAVDAWLGNWDVVGLDYDNMQNLAGRAIRLDTGGALKFRAQGQPKGKAWGNTVGELETLLDDGMNWQSANIFKGITEKQKLESAIRIGKISDAKITELVEKYMPGNKAAQSEMINTLIARKNYILDKYPKAQPGYAEALENAVQDAQKQVASQIKELDYDITEAVKGLGRLTIDGSNIRNKDIERVALIKDKLKNIKSSKYPLSAAQKRKLTKHYKEVIEDLEDAIKPGVGSKANWQGSMFEGYAVRNSQNSLIIDEDKLKVTVKKSKPSKPRTTPEKAQSIIRRSMGSDATETDIYGAPNPDHDDFKELHVENKRSIFNYSIHYYKEINEKLREKSATKAQMEYRDLLNETLDLIPAYEGLSARGQNFKFDSQRIEFIKRHQEALKTGKTVKYRSFISSTKGSRAAFDGPVYLMLTGRNGRFIKNLSGHAWENEVLFKAGSSFKVTGIEQIKGKWIIHLTELDDAGGFDVLEFTEAMHD